MKSNIGCLASIILAIILFSAIKENSPLLAISFFIIYIVAMIALILYNPSSNTEEEEPNIKIVMPMACDDNFKTRLLEVSKTKNIKDIAVMPMPDFFAQKEKWEITLITTDSKSVMLPPFLEIIKQYPTYKDYIENSIQQYEVSFPYQHINDFKRVYDMVKNLRGTRVYICGDLMEKKELSQLLICAGEKNISPKKDFCYGVSQYTYNPFGCHRIQIHSMGENAWYNFAYMKDGKVLIDKNSILEYMKANLKRFKYCPFMNLQEIWNNFLLLPNEISLYDENFTIVKTYNGGIEVSLRWRFYEHLEYEQLKEMYGDRLLSKR